MTSSHPTGEPPLRTDAERNRAAVIEAAKGVFAEHGLDAPMTEVARRAGVGIATLYRRFPTRDDLITGVFEEKMATYLDAVTAALGDVDPWHGFCRYVERVCTMQSEDRGFTDVLTMTFPRAEAFEANRAAAYRGFEKLIVKAKAGGRLRPDFRSQDLVMLLMANAGVVASAGDAAPATSKRLVSYLVAACDTQHRHSLAAAPTKRQMYDAMQTGTCDPRT